jgi:endonuclease/exonuclease/phosphatase family metal-dependent hydrolase
VEFRTTGTQLNLAEQNWINAIFQGICERTSDLRPELLVVKIHTLVVLLCGLSNPAWADFCMLTQNGLRLGHGQEEQLHTKREGFRALFDGYDVVALQEIMAPGEPALLAPHGYTATVSTARGSTARGSTGYREHYAWLTRDSAIQVLASADYPDAAGVFARPPFGIAVEDRDKGRFWLVNVHIVFGKQGRAPRRKEVAAMADVHAWFSTTPLPDGTYIGQVVVVGDWNLPTTDEAFAALSRTGLHAAPNVKSTLNARGIFTSAYDHFLWDRSRLGVDFAEEPRDLGGLPPETFRENLSDHAGLAGYVMADPAARRPAHASCPLARPSV